MDVMKLLNGSELAGFIKERQAHAVRALRQAHNTIPKLAIIQTKDDPVINTYVRLKKAYGADILVEVDLHNVNQTEVPELIQELNRDDSVHGIILQLPLEDKTQTDELCDKVSTDKDVDALGKDAVMEPATPMAIMWLLAGYNVELAGKKILLIGDGKLVGRPLSKNLRSSGYDVTVADRETKNLPELTIEADVIITATGRPAIIYPDMVKQGSVVVDAGVASEEGKIVGDLDESMYERDDLTITPKKGGVGPLTICALFENVIKSANREGSANDN